METSSKGVGDVEGKAFAGEGAPGWEECPGNKYFLVFKYLNILSTKYLFKSLLKIYIFVSIEECPVKKYLLVSIEIYSSLC